MRVGESQQTHTCSGPSAHVMRARTAKQPLLRWKGKKKTFSAGWWLPRQLKTELRGLFKLPPRECCDAEAAHDLKRTKTWLSAQASWNANDLTMREIPKPTGKNCTVCIKCSRFLDANECCEWRGAVCAGFGVLTSVYKFMFRQHMEHFQQPRL